MRVEYHPETAEDLNKAIDFYERRQEGLGKDLREEITNPLIASLRIHIFTDKLKEKSGDILSIDFPSRFSIK